MLPKMQFYLDSLQSADCWIHFEEGDELRAKLLHFCAEGHMHGFLRGGIADMVTWNRTRGLSVIATNKVYLLKMLQF